MTPLPSITTSLAKAATDAMENGVVESTNHVYGSARAKWQVRSGWRVALSVLISLVMLGCLVIVPAAQPFAGSGSCSGGTCSFCPLVTLSAYSGSSADRCAYGHFVGANGIENNHPTGRVLMCAGMKSSSDGTGNNVGPIGVTCTNSPEYSLILTGPDTAGYMTIINHDSSAPHYNFAGSGSY